MCGRFTLVLEPGDLQDEFDLGGIPDEYTPRYNIAPTQPVSVVRDAEERQVEMFRWGLIPSWAKDMSIGSKMINARAETLAEKPSFRTALAKRRNIIFSSGFFEWRKTGASKEPLFIHLPHQRAFAFAGLWETWLHPDGHQILTTTIITCAANPLIAEFHDRMPVILNKEMMWHWLNPNLSTQQAQQLLLPFPADEMSYYPVTARVNSPAFDQPVCIEPDARLF
jgi:putative SOS response-associated peptidase YedK